MQLLPVLVLVSIAIRSQAEIFIATPSLDETSSGLVEDLVKIVTSCYPDLVGHGVGLAGNLPDTLARTLSARHLIPAVLIDGTKKLAGSFAAFNQFEDHYAALIRFRHKLSVFIVEASSAGELKEIILLNIEHTIWHNNMASYFILDRSFGCVNSQNFLLVAWGFKILHAKVMCYHYKSDKIIVSYNPFTDKAPLPWQRDFKEYNSNHFVLFSRKYGEHEAICIDLDFDKDKDLGGTKILLEGLPPGVNARAATGLHEYQFWSENDRVVSTIIRALNATAVFTGQERDFFVPNVHMKINIQALFKETEYRFVTYPREQMGKVLVSHSTRESRPNIIRPVIDIDSAFGLGMVYSITPFIFKLFVQQPLVSALLNLIRKTCNIDFTNLPHNNAPRIHVTSLLLFAVAIQGMYQGHLSCMLTTRIPRRNVDTIADIPELGYKRVYIYYPEKVKIEEPELRKHFVAVYNPYQCIQYTKRDALAVCLWDRTPELLDLAQAFDLHVSSQSVTLSYGAFEIHYNLPYEQRINVIIGKLAAADLLRHRDASSPTRLAVFRLTNSYRRNNNFEKINLRELSYAFVILSIGLACATITLIAELAIRYKCRIVKRQITSGHV